MLQKTASLSPYDRMTSAWRDMRARADEKSRAAPRAVPAGPDYVIEAALEDGVGVYRIYKPAATREEMSRRMQELSELMRRKNYSGALIDMRSCSFEERSAANDLSREAVLPYAVNPLWRLALLVTPEDAANAAPMLEAILKLHHRAGVQMLQFDDPATAVQWLQKAREGRGERL